MSQSQSIPQDTFLRMSANLLHKAFQEASRTQSKNLFRDLNEGRTVALTQVKMEDESLLRFDLAIDCTEFRGNLNFGAFKASVQVLIGNLAKALEEGKELPVYTAEGNTDTLLFGCTAVTVEKDQPNVMVLGADTATAEGVVKLNLMYLNPEQFAAS